MTYSFLSIGLFDSIYAIGKKKKKNRYSIVVVFIYFILKWLHLRNIE